MRPHFSGNSKPALQCRTQLIHNLSLSPQYEFKEARKRGTSNHKISDDAGTADKENHANHSLSYDIVHFCSIVW